MRRHAAIWTLALGIALAPGAVGAQTFMGLGEGSSAADISADGLTVIGQAPHSDGRLWTVSAGWEEPCPDSSLAPFRVVSGDGQFAVRNAVDISRGDCGDGLCNTSDGSEGPTFDRNFCVTGISADGTVLIGSNVYDGTAIRWTAEEGRISIVENSRAGGESGDGSVVVGTYLDMVGRPLDGAWRWTAEEGPVAVVSSGRATGVSADGLAVVGVSGSNWLEGFHWTAERGAMSLGFLPGAVQSVPTDISADGTLVVGESGNLIAGSSDSEAFIWDRSNGMQAIRDLLGSAGLDVTGWRLGHGEALLFNDFSDVSISDNGRTIAGSGRNPDGQPEAWIATLDCPSDDDCDTVPDPDDNCPGLRTTNINDANGNGIGDMCECGDQTGDGHTDMADILGMVDVIFDRAEASPLCDTNDDDACNVADILGVNAKLFGAPAYCARYPEP